MSKSTVERIVSQVRVKTELPIQEVLQRLDVALNRSGGNGDSIVKLITSSEWIGNREIQQAQLQDKIGQHFGFFNDLNHSAWLRKYLLRDDIPEIHVYTLGNPLIAQTMLKHDILAGLYVPPRVAVVSDSVDADSGTTVVYDLPSAQIAIGDCSDALRRAAQELDRKLEGLVQEVTSVTGGSSSA